MPDNPQITARWVSEHLVTQHPRLLATASRWGELRRLRETDIDLDRLLNHIERGCLATLDEPVVTRQMEGRRLLTVTRQAFSVIVWTAFAYRLTGEDRWRDRATQEIEALIAFDDWNPSHFLDTATGALAVGIGYDWLQDTWDDATRDRVRAGLMRLGVGPAVRHVTDDPEAWWPVSENNWNSVCYGGTIAGALAIAEHEPDAAATLIRHALTHNPKVLATYEPDGVYPEGPSYWVYGTTYQVVLADVLDSALGTTLGLGDHPALLGSGMFMRQATGPTGLMFNFADADPPPRPNAALFWMARHIGQPGLVSADRRRDWSRIDHLHNRFLPLAALWWPDAPSAEAPPLPHAWHGRGPNPVAMFRSNWGDPDAWYLAVKGGSGQVNHGHLDAGSFVLDAWGVRWAIDPGRVDYHAMESRGLEIFDRDPDSDRWKIYRHTNFAHNTLTLNGQLHRVDGFAALEMQSLDDGRSAVTIDLTETLGKPITRATRTFTFNPAGTVEVTDEVQGLGPDDTLTWAMLTTAKATHRGHTITLEQGGRTLRLTLDINGLCDVETGPPGLPEGDHDAPPPGTQQVQLNCKPPTARPLVIRVRVDSNDH